MGQLQLIRSDDGSFTLFDEEMDQTYHSRRGALGESLHVFIKAGLEEAQRSIGTQLNILEIGFGTGLNALLTLQAARKKKLAINYVSLEINPLDIELISQLDYAAASGFPDDKIFLLKLHESEWNSAVEISSFFSLEKRSQNLLIFSDIPERYDLIYFDAFAPRVQPELWTQEIFQNIIKHMKRGGILVTYCSKSIVRKAMMAAGFEVEKIQGPWGKREMVRARKK